MKFLSCFHQHIQYYSKKEDTALAESNVTRHYRPMGWSSFFLLSTFKALGKLCLHVGQQFDQTLRYLQELCLQSFLFKLQNSFLPFLFYLAPISKNLTIFCSSKNYIQNIFFWSLVFCFVSGCYTKQFSDFEYFFWSLCILFCFWLLYKTISDLNIF